MPLLLQAWGCSGDNRLKTTVCSVAAAAATACEPAKDQIMDGGLANSIVQVHRADLGCINR